MSDAAQQPSLFADALRQGETSPPSPTSASAQDNVILVSDPSDDDLITRFLRGMCSGRRWEREQLIGATDEEVAGVFGDCWSGGDHFDYHFRAHGEPAMRCTRHPSGEEVFTLSVFELAARIRALTGLRPRASDEEAARLLKARLDAERRQARNDIYGFAQSILKDTAHKKENGFTRSIVDLLFAEDALTEMGERRTLESIVDFLRDQRQSSTAAATKTALTLVDRARHTWESVEAYWLNTPVNSPRLK